jgi:twinkle protein
MLMEHTAHLLLKHRRLDVEVAARLGVESFDNQDGRDDWIAIPFYQNGKVVNWKYRTIGEPKLFFQKAGGKQIFWNEDVLRDPSLADTEVVITEGELDAAVAIQCDFPRTVSVPGGAPDKPIEDDAGKKYQFLDAAKGLLKNVKSIILAVDGDEKGSYLLHDLALRLGRGRCKYVRYPVGCKDLNDVLKKFGPSAVRKVLESAQFVTLNGVFRMSELPPLPAVPAHNPLLDGMNEHAKVRLADLWVVTGVPGSGKSTFVNDLTCRLADGYGWKIAFASFEQTPQTDHRKPERDQSRTELKAADDFIEKHFVFIAPDDEDDNSHDVLWFLDMAEAAVVREGVQIVVLDPWNELDHPETRSKTDYVGEAIKKLKRFAKRLQILLIVVAHPAKLDRDRKTGAMPIPTPYDISDSQHWFNKPDVVLIVHPHDGGQTLVRVAKVRYRDAIGEPGDETYRFNRYQGRFERTTGVES